MPRLWHFREVAACSIFLATGSAVQAQWTPIVAKWRFTQERTAPDGTRSQKQTDGRFLRWSNGDELNVRSSAADSVNTEIGTFIDAAAGIAYRINTSEHTATIEHSFGGARPQVHGTPPPGRASRTVNGVYCVSVPIVGQNITSGEGCFSPDYDVMIRRDFVRRNGDYAFHSVEEMYDIALGKEPDRGQVPQLKEFRVLEKSSQQGIACTACSRNPKNK
jgi:hypothetical protein